MTAVAVQGGRANWPARLRRHRVGRDPADGRRQVLRVGAALAAITVAYHYSLTTLVRSLQVDTPLAYLGLVPIISLMLVAAVHVPPPDELDIHDRQVDYIVGLPLLVGALAIMLVMPVRMSTTFWTWRVDLLSLPLFVAGTIALVFGVRVLWRLRFPVFFLFLAWPVPYTLFVQHGMQSFTEGTVAALRLVLARVTVAHPVPSADGSLFTIGHAGERFTLSVASACAGVNGVVGFVLVGTAFASVVRGRRLPKLLWLVLGMVLLWVLNIGRILLIFEVGRRWGETAAIDGLHPYIGLVLFNVGVIAMLLAMRWFGLQIGVPDTTGDAKPSTATAATTAPTRRAAVPRARTAIGIVIALAIVGGVANAGMQQYDLVADNLGAPRLTAFTGNPSRPVGWTPTQVAEYTWARRYFGETSSWFRYQYSPGTTTQGVSRFQSDVPVITDVISTSDLHAFSVYGLESCYRFHGYSIRDAETVDLGGGITGNVVSYYNPKQHRDWTTLSWEWPVRTARGTRYERVVMMMQDTESARLSAPPVDPGLSRKVGLSVQNALRGATGRSPNATLRRTRDFLIGFSQEVVQAQADRPTTSGR